MHYPFSPSPGPGGALAVRTAVGLASVGGPLLRQALRHRIGRRPARGRADIAVRDKAHTASERRRQHAAAPEPRAQRRWRGAPGRQTEHDDVGLHARRVEQHARDGCQRGRQLPRLGVVVRQAQRALRCGAAC